MSIDFVTNTLNSNPDQMANGNAATPKLGAPSKREAAYKAAVSYWMQQNETIKRRIEFQLKDEFEKDEFLTGLQTLYQEIICTAKAPPSEHNPFEYAVQEISGDW